MSKNLAMVTETAERLVSPHTLGATLRIYTGAGMVEYHVITGIKLSVPNGMVLIYVAGEVFRFQLTEEVTIMREI